MSVEVQKNEKIPDPVLVSFDSKESMDQFHTAMHNICECVVAAAKRGVFTKEEMDIIVPSYHIVYNKKKTFDN